MRKIYNTLFSLILIIIIFFIIAVSLNWNLYRLVKPVNYSLQGKLSTSNKEVTLSFDSLTLNYKGLNIKTAYNFSLEVQELGFGLQPRTPNFYLVNEKDIKKVTNPSKFSGQFTPYFDAKNISPKINYSIDNNGQIYMNLFFDYKELNKLKGEANNSYRLYLQQVPLTKKINSSVPIQFPMKEKKTIHITNFGEIEIYQGEITDQSIELQTVAHFNLPSLYSFNMNLVGSSESRIMSGSGQGTISNTISTHTYKYNVYPKVIFNHPYQVNIDSIELQTEGDKEKDYISITW